MPRKGKKITPFKDYESATNRGGYEVDYIRILHLQLVCMQELSSSAFRLYINMKDYANGDTEFTYPHRIYKTFLSNQTFIIARDELIEKGYLKSFISHKNLRTENKYTFSSEWRERNKDLISKVVKESIEKNKNRNKTQ